MFKSVRTTHNPLHVETAQGRIVRRLLEELKLPFKTGRLFDCYPTDFYLSKYRLVIQADGDYWHANPSQYGLGKKPLSKVQCDVRKNDTLCNEFLVGKGYRVLRLWETDLKTDPGKCLDQINIKVGECKMEHTIPGVSLDIGTMNLVAARPKAVSGEATFKRVRDAFLDLDLEAKRSLKLSKVDFIEKGNSLIVVGDAALTMANLLKREVRRPLSKGVISAGEIDAQEILASLIQSVLGKPSVEGEHCFYSVPAAPLDDPTQDIIYHTEVFRGVLSSLGYTPHPMNEAMAIVYSECEKENFSGLAISFGSGMANVALSYNANLGMSFSLARGGDFIDQQSAKAVGKTASQMCSIKERGIDLADPKGRDQSALALYIRSLINYALQNIASQFKKVQSSIDLPEPVPFIVSGGTSLAGGFLEVFKSEFAKVQRSFPIQISEVRLAQDPLTAVANGLLVLATEEHRA